MSQPQFTAFECCQAPEEAQVIEFVAMCAAVANNLVPNLLSASKALFHSKKANISIMYQYIRLPNHYTEAQMVSCGLHMWAQGLDGERFEFELAA